MHYFSVPPRKQLQNIKSLLYCTNTFSLGCDVSGFHKHQRTHGLLRRSASCLQQIQFMIRLPEVRGSSRSQLFILQFPHFGRQLASSYPSPLTEAICCRLLMKLFVPATSWVLLDSHSNKHLRNLSFQSWSNISWMCHVKSNYEKSSSGWTRANDLLLKTWNHRSDMTCPSPRHTQSLPPSLLLPISGLTKHS